jgi:predicted aconitase
VKLTDDEMAMLDGREGKARQKAMELLVRYGEALGAERMVDTNNVCGSMSTTNPFSRDLIHKYGSFEALVSELNYDSDETVEIPMVKAFSCQLQQAIDPDHWQMMGATQEIYELNKFNEAFEANIGINMMCTCAPFLVGNVPLLGEHCAWMESSAVVYINGVLGARTNVEGRESSSSAMLTGKIPYWGLHIPGNRLGTYLVNVEWDVDSEMDWGLLGYYIGYAVKEQIPVVNGISKVPNLDYLKHFGAAAASSGGVAMFHIAGITPEAHTLAEAFDKKKPVETLRFGRAERKIAYERLNAYAKDTHVDFVMLGCPHASIKQVWEISKLLKGKRINSNTQLWIFTPRTIRQLADRNGYTKIINDAGAVLMSDTCPALGQVMPKGTKVAATNSAKQTHYLPSIMGVQAWYGSLEECIDAAITGQWGGELR